MKDSFQPSSPRSTPAQSHAPVLDLILSLLRTFAEEEFRKYDFDYQLQGILTTYDGIGRSIGNDDGSSEAIEGASLKVMLYVLLEKVFMCVTT